MSDWNHNVIFICPIDFVTIAKQMAMALDPDIGGYESFGVLVSPTGQLPATHAVCATPARQSFVDTLPTISTDAAALKALVDADYAARWPNETAPTLQECEIILENLQIFIDQDLIAVLENNGLIITGYENG